MQTADLIARLAEDLAPARRGLVARTLALGLLLGALGAAVLLLALLGLNPHLSGEMRGWHFWMRFAYTLALALLGLPVLARQARAGAASRRPALLLLLPVLALIVLAAIALSAPDADAAALVMGTTWVVCPWLILTLSLPVLAGLVLALRRLAPTRPALAGAAAGLVAGAAAATVYGLHCPELAAPFILVWYTLGITLAAGLGALIGRYALRW